MMEIALIKDCFKAAVHSLRTDRKGITALEYGLLAAGLALAIITAAGGLGNKLKNAFTAIGTQLTS